MPKLRGNKTGSGSSAGLLSSPFDSNGSPFVGTGLSYMSSDNPMYDAYYRANPFVNQQYELTWFDKAFHGLFRTPYDKWLQEMQLNASQWDAGVVDMQQQNEYNSEVAQAQRMRDAGENPDLLGTEGVSDAARPTPDVQDVQIPDAVDMSQIGSFVSNLADCFSGAFAMVRQGVSLIRDFADIDAQNISNAGNMQELALRIIQQNFPADDITSDESLVDWQNKLFDIGSRSVPWSHSLAKSLGLSRRQRKSFEDAYFSAIPSSLVEVSRLKEANELVDNRRKFAMSSSSRFYDQSMDVMNESVKILVVAKDDLEELLAGNKVSEQNIVSSELKNRGIEADIQGQYLDALNNGDIGAKRALNDIEQADLLSMQNRIDKVLKDTREKLLGLYQNMARDGNEFAQFMVYNMTLKEFMNVDLKLKGDFGIGKVLPKTMQGWIPSFGVESELGIGF